MVKMGTSKIKVTAWIAPGLFKEGEILTGSTVESALSTLYETNNIGNLSDYEIKLDDKIVSLNDILVSDSILILSKVKIIKGAGPEYTPSERIVVYYCHQRQKKKREQAIEAFFLKWDVAWPENIIVEKDRKGRTSFIDQADLLDHHDVTLVVYDIEDLLNENVVSRLKELISRSGVRITLIVVSKFKEHPVADKGVFVRDHDDMIKKRLREFSESKKPKRSSRQYDVDRGNEREERNKKLWSWTTIIMGSYLDEKARNMVDLPFNDEAILKILNRTYSQQIEKHFGSKEQKKSDEPVTISFANFQARLNELGLWDEYENLKQENRELDRKKRFPKK